MLIMIYMIHLQYSYYYYDVIIKNIGHLNYINISIVYERGISYIRDYNMLTLLPNYKL